ncbi:hypothetical protein ENBRE01_1606 [Enteropsectra breve]|nr:hypothetical protein ENBRE01_1606 [Enteropsectra breve]
MSKVTTIIYLGPTMNFYPIASESNPRFLLPVFNLSLFDHTMEILSPHSLKVIIVVIEDHYQKIVEMSEKYRSRGVKVVIKQSCGYDGIAEVFNRAREEVVTETVILCKCDMFLSDSIDHYIYAFQKSGDDMFVSLGVNPDPDRVAIIYDNTGKLLCYDGDIFKYAQGSKAYVTTRFQLKSFYIFNKKILNMCPPEAYGFKRNVVPHLVRQDARLRVVFSNNYPINNLEDYKTQVKYIEYMCGQKLVVILGDKVRNMIPQGILEVIAKPNARLGGYSRIRRTLILDNVEIGDRTQILESLIGNNVVIGADCKIENCNIGNNVVIPPFTVLKDQTISLD